MKSAYELAMERLEKEQGPGRALTDTQRAELAAIDNRFDAKVAETKLTFEGRMQAEPQNRLALREELSQELASLEEKREREKAAIWDASA